MVHAARIGNSYILTKGFDPRLLTKPYWGLDFKDLEFTEVSSPLLRELYGPSSYTDCASYLRVKAFTESLYSKGDLITGIGHLPDSKGANHLTHLIGSGDVSLKFNRTMGWRLGNVLNYETRALFDLRSYSLHASGSHTQPYIENSRAGLIKGLLSTTWNDLNPKIHFANTAMLFGKPNFTYQADGSGDLTITRHSGERYMYQILADLLPPSAGDELLERCAAYNEFNMQQEAADLLINHIVSSNLKGGGALFYTPGQNDTSLLAELLATL